MYQSLFDNARTILSILLCGISIKMLDDYIDEKKDFYVPYMMALLCISSALWKGCITLFLSSYIAGMFHDENLKLASSLKAYQEQVIVFIISTIAGGIKLSIWAVFIICTIQLIDDLMDMKKDRYEGKKNWAVKFGRVEAASASIIFFLLSLSLYRLKTVMCIFAALIISGLFNLQEMRR
jgi:1,4-dihydroxy-2-naphthoate octaprenyltransferase